MRILLLFLFVGVASAFPANDQALLKNGIEKLIKEVIEYFRWLLQRHDPYTPPGFSDHIKSDSLECEVALTPQRKQNMKVLANVQLSTVNVQVTGETNFKTDSLYFNLPRLFSTFQMTFPKAHIEGLYEISGMVFSRQVSGKSKFSVDINDFVLSGTIQYTIVDHNLQVEDINLNYTLSGANIAASQLHIEGVSDEDVENFLNNEFLKEVEQHKAEFCELAGRKIQELANEFLIGKTLNFMKQLIASTPDPPPFPFIDN